MRISWPASRGGLWPRSDNGSYVRRPQVTTAHSGYVDPVGAQQRRRMNAAAPDIRSRAAVFCCAVQQRATGPGWIQPPWQPDSDQGNGLQTGIPRLKGRPQELPLLGPCDSQDSAKCGLPTALATCPVLWRSARWTAWIIRTQLGVTSGKMERRHNRTHRFPPCSRGILASRLPTKRYSWPWRATHGVYPPCAGHRTPHWPSTRDDRPGRSSEHSRDSNSWVWSIDSERRT